MAISGAIFDCDGTLIDSMPMWHDVTVGLLERYGVPDPEGVFVESESLPLGELCSYLHDRHIRERSASELEGEFLALVREAYAHDVRLLCGCREFLDDLRSHGVPMVVASSTPVAELELALEAQGIRDYFSEIVSTGGPVRSKDFPDIWHIARAALQTPVAETWVFEDAPFSLRSARSVGFPTVCLFSPHGDREVGECRPFSSVFVHGYPELSYELLQDYAEPSLAIPGTMPMAALIVDGSPEPSGTELVRRLADGADYVIAADAGARALHAAGVAPDMFCGDGDSVGSDVGAWAHAVAGREISLPREKYATDLAYAIGCARHEAARRGVPLRLTITCATGGRPDHALAVVGQLANNVDLDIRVVEDAYELRLLSPRGARSWRFGADARGRTFSAIALAPGTVVSERGSKWELDHAPLALLDDAGVSNIVVSEDACVTCHEGCVAVYLMG
ncbi:MAG: thiamine diphosphokinase [Olsenella sp.]|nr:thiamine diphosphokinase [Olsenella sp.]